MIDLEGALDIPQQQDASDASLAGVVQDGMADDEAMLLKQLKIVEQDQDDNTGRNGFFEPGDGQ